MFLLAFLFVVLWVVAEVYVLVLVAQAIGVLLTIVLLIAAWPLGRWAIRSAGRPVWRRFNEAVAQRRPPGREVVDGALVILGGTMLIVPGFISDAVGLLLLLPATRAPVRGLLIRNFQSRLVTHAARFGRGSRFDRQGGTGLYDVDGTATEVDPPHLPS
jgi:UPF0716 protein FxsA